MPLLSRKRSTPPHFWTALIAWLGLITACSLLLILVLYGSPEAIGGRGKMVGNVNGDTLVPMQMAWNTRVNPAAWETFQWSRVASLLDISWFWVAEGWGLGWRPALLIYTSLTTAGLSLCLALIASRLTASSMHDMAPRAALAILLLVLPLTILHLTFGLKLQGFLQTFLPESHGNGLMLALLAAGLRPERRLLLFLVCVIGTVSDLLFIFWYALPLILAGHIAGPDTFRNAKPWVSAALGSIVGVFLRHLMFMQEVFSVSLQERLRTAPELLATLFQGEMAWLILIGTVFLLTMTVRAFRLDRTSLQSLLLAQGSLSALAALGITALGWVDHAGWRYAMPALWWPIAAGLGLLPPPQRWLGLSALGGAATLAPLTLPPLLHWRSPTEVCLARIPGLKAGLADYWQSREIEASANWQRQIATIDQDGAPLVLANNVALYWQDARAGGHPAQFNYIVVDSRLNAAALRARYGAPTRIIPCPDADIWTYRSRLTPMPLKDQLNWLRLR